MSELAEAIEKAIKDLLNGAKRVEYDVSSDEPEMYFNLTAYKVGKILRIDLKPR